MDERKPRSRAANFTKNEVSTLLFLTRKYKSQIEPKPLGSSSNKAKAEAWRRITREFNAITGNRDNPRSVDVLRNKLCNIKKIVKRKARQKIIGNDEGHREEITVLELENVKVEASPLRVVQSPDILVDEESPNLLMEETPHVLVAESPNLVTEGLLELQKRCLLEEHALKLRLMQEKHDRSLKIQEEEAEEKLRQMREEHMLQMEILQLRKHCLVKL
nr:PREDICTED: uncharacterized protein LOC103313938 isoform X1 [Tribolium castaneum]|eukprot:XP_008196731.1 PREDICTED: uncharacterized protein LOC103313938 isoform X1 [Tribolium castaneum]